MPTERLQPSEVEDQRSDQISKRRDAIRDFAVHQYTIHEQQHSDHAIAVRQSLDPSEPSHSQERQDYKHVTYKHDINSTSNDTTNDQSSEVEKVESTSDASIATPTEQMASKYNQGSKWKHWLKTAIITLLAATGNAQEAYVNTASIRYDHGTVPIPGGSLEQRFMLRGSRDWPGLVQKQESEKHSSSLPQENLVARYEQEKVSSQKSGADPLENLGQKHSDERSSTDLPQNIEKIQENHGRKPLAFTEQARRRNQWYKVRGRISKSVKKIRIRFPHFEL